MFSNLNDLSKQRDVPIVLEQHLGGVVLLLVFVHEAHHVLVALVGGVGVVVLVAVVGEGLLGGGGEGGIGEEGT